MKKTEKETCRRYLQAESEFKFRTQKDMIQEKCIAFGRFNDWEQQILEKPNKVICLAVVFELYDLMPDRARQRPVSVEGIIKMHEGLSCLA